MNSMESGEIQISSVHHVERTWLEHKLVEDFHIVNLAWRKDYHRWEVSSEVQEGVKLDCCLSFAEFCPGKKGETQVDGCGIQGVDRLIQAHSEYFPRIEFSSMGDKDLGKIAKDPPVPLLVCDGERVPGHLPPEPCVIKLGLQGSETCLDVSKTLSECKLSENQGQELVEATEFSKPMISPIAFDTLLELVSGKPIQDLGEHRPSFVHGSLLQFS